MYREPRFLKAGDRALVVEFGNAIDPKINTKIRGFIESLKRESIEGIDELVPTYRSVLVYFDPLIIDCEALESKLYQIAISDSEKSDAPPWMTLIPVCYGGAHGPDLSYVATHTQLTESEVIRLHHRSDYLIYMMGFLPGFPYMGGMNPQLATPRLEKPRTKIPGGSVGIAGTQTGIYPITSPGGWRVIGRTPLKLYDPQRDPPMLLSAGHYIRFYPIEEDQYQDILRQVEAGTYQVQVKPYEGR